MHTVTCPGTLRSAKRSRTRALKAGPIWSVLLALATLVLASACAKPLPENQKLWLGSWKNQQASLSITADGWLEWHRRAGGDSTSISAPVLEISDRKIVAGVWIVKFNFDVAETPRLRGDGLWTVTVDGQELLKADPQGLNPGATTVPPLNQLRALVSDNLHRLDQGIQSDDYSAFLTESSLMYQSHVTNEILRKRYRTLHEGKVALAPLMAGDLTLTSEPAISEHGELMVKGRYAAAQGHVLSVNVDYVYSQSSWKLLDLDFELDRHEK
jgi:hypothetical protein